MNSNVELDENSIDIINAVKAEAARFGFDGKSLAVRMGHDRNWIYERYRYRKPFDTNDLGIIAKILGVPVSLIFQSAELGSKMRASSMEVTA
jgi:hypothetical protein